MGFTEKLVEHSRAGFSGLWIKTEEPDRAMGDMIAACRKHGWTLAAWDIDRGARVIGDGKVTAVGSGTDPVSAVKALATLVKSDGSETVILAMLNAHRFLNYPELMQAVQHNITDGKSTGAIVCVLAPVVQIPVELEKAFVVIDHDLPDRAELGKIAEGVATQAGELPEPGPARDRMLDAAAGLTRYEAENAFALSLVRSGKVRPDALWEIKEGTLKKSGTLTLHRGGEKFADLGGLENLKRFCAKALNGGGQGEAKPRGVVLLGVPGTGKSAFAKALGNETGRPTIVLDIGSLMGSLVGQTEEQTRRALQQVDRMAPAILFIDEVEKALAGTGGGGAHDSGVSERMFGTLLSWMQDHTTDVFLVMTSNDMSRLKAEFTRQERIDGVFFIDMPGRAEKDVIWGMYRKRFGVKAADPAPTDESWTGAEIKACCRLSAMLGVPLVEAALNVVPVAVTAADRIDAMRDWASGRCLSAGKPGLYVKPQAEQVAPSLNGDGKAPARRIARGVPAGV